MRVQEVAMNRPALDRAALVLVLTVSGALLLPAVAAAQGTPPTMRGPPH